MSSKIQFRLKRIGRKGERGTKLCVCDTFFYPSDPRQIYCAKCSGNYYKINALKERKKRVCVDCGKDLLFYAKGRCKICYTKQLVVDINVKREYNRNYARGYREKSREHTREYVRQSRIRARLM